MNAGRPLGLSQSATSSQVAPEAITGVGLMVCPIVPPSFFGFGPASFLAIYRMAYERAVAEVASQPTLYERLQRPSWN